MIPGWQMEAFERLRTEIVRSAVKDYESALKRSDRLGAVCTEQVKLETWFLSKWGQMLSGDNGELIIEKCRASYKTRPNNKRRKFLPDDIQQQIYQEYKNGDGLKVIKKRHKIAASTIYDIVGRWEK